MASASVSPGHTAGADLSSWELTVGDGLYTVPGQAPSGANDISLISHGDRSELAANIHRRGVMAHAIGFKRFADVGDLAFSNTAGVDFRIPFVPSTTNWDMSAQTVEIGLFVWDGAASRLDHGIAMQWILNPWVPNFGAIRVWQQTEQGPAWRQVAHLPPDDRWHRASLEFDADKALAVLAIDGVSIPIATTLTPKPSSWGATVDARFQVETVSLWPGQHQSAPPHRAEFRNWYWYRTNA